MTAAQIVGQGRYTYRMDSDWAKLPDGWNMPAAAVAGDSRTAYTVSTATRIIPLLFSTATATTFRPGAQVSSPLPTPSSSTGTTMSGSSTATTTR